MHQHNWYKKMLEVYFNRGEAHRALVLLGDFSILTVNPITTFRHNRYIWQLCQPTVGNPSCVCIIFVFVSSLLLSLHYYGWPVLLSVWLANDRGMEYQRLLISSCDGNLDGTLVSPADSSWSYQCHSRYHLTWDSRSLYIERPGASFWVSPPDHFLTLSQNKAMKTRYFLDFLLLWPLLGPGSKFNSPPQVGSYLLPLCYPWYNTEIHWERTHI